MEERLRFYDEGVAPRKNATVMAEAMAAFKRGSGDDAMADDDDEVGERAVECEGKKKKPKKSKSLGEVRAVYTAMSVVWCSSFSTVPLVILDVWTATKTERRRGVERSGEASQG